MNGEFNLLRYPMQARQRRLRWRWGSGLVGFVLGLALGGVAVHALQQDFQGMLSEHTLLLAQSGLQKERLAQDKARREATDLARRQQTQLVQVQQHQRSWARLHQALLQEAGRSAWMLERLQVDGDRLELQGHAHDAQALQAVQTHLSEQLDSPLTLLSLSSIPTASREGSAPGKGLEFVWQTPWQAALPSAARRAP